MCRPIDKWGSYLCSRTLLVCLIVAHRYKFWNTFRQWLLPLESWPIISRILISALMYITYIHKPNESGVIRLMLSTMFFSIKFSTPETLRFLANKVIRIYPGKTSDHELLQATVSNESTFIYALKTATASHAGSYVSRWPLHRLARDGEFPLSRNLTQFS